jgi:hypothetical protein
VSGSTTVTGTVDREVHMLVPRRWPSPAKPDADTFAGGRHHARWLHPKVVKALAAWTDEHPTHPVAQCTEGHGSTGVTGTGLRWTTGGGSLGGGVPARHTVRFATSPTRI